MRSLTWFCWAFAAVAIYPIARATPILEIAPTACPNNPAACTATNGVVTAGLLTPDLITTPDTLLNDFTAAFKNWDTTGAWTLKEAQLSNTAILDITVYQAYVDQGPGCGVTCGGAEIDITYTPGAATDPPAITNTSNIRPGNAVWSQAIDTNAKRDPSLPGDPYLDNAPGTPNRNAGPPAYPYQYVGSSFYDKPGRDATAIWIGDAYISTINYRTKTITIYDGVEWGFTVTPAPEPSTLAMFALGAVGLALYRRRWGTIHAPVGGSCAEHTSPTLSFADRRNDVAGVGFIAR